MEALKALSTFFVDNSLRSRRNLRGDIEKRSLAINESFESAFREVKQVKKQNWIVLIDCIGKFVQLYRVILHCWRCEPLNSVLIPSPPPLSDRIRTAIICKYVNM